MGTGNSFKVFILLGLLFAVVTLIASEVSAANDLAEKSAEEETSVKNGLQDAKYAGYQGGGGYPGNGGYQGGGGNGGRYQGGRGGGGRGRFRCRHGCCDRGGYYRGDCYNCCYSAAHAKAFSAEATTTTDNLKP